MIKQVVFVGAGSHADAVRSVMDESKYELVGFFDDKNITEHDGIPVLGLMKDICEYLDDNQNMNVFITIGDNIKRKEIFSLISPLFYSRMINIVSDSACIMSSDAIEGRGVFVGANAFLGAKVKVGDNTIINTGAIVEHHSVIGSHINIAPRVVINGLCNIHDKCYIGSGSVVIQVIDIAEGTLIGAGAVVVKNIVTSGTYVGVPVHCIREM